MVLRLKRLEQGVYNAKVVLGDDRSGTEVQISIGSGLRERQPVLITCQRI